VFGSTTTADQTNSEVRPAADVTFVQVVPPLVVFQIPVFTKAITVFAIASHAAYAVFSLVGSTAIWPIVTPAKAPPAVSSVQVVPPLLETRMPFP